MKLSIVIPCYNEEQNIPLILKKFAQCITRNDIEIILVNNGSTDKSQEIIQMLLPQYSFARTVLVPVNQGYGYGILAGLKTAQGDFLGWTHADLQTDPEDILKSLAILEDNDFDQRLFIKGSRKNRPTFDQFFTLGMALFESIYLGKILFDINAQPNVFSRKFYDKWENPPCDFSLDLYALYLAKKMNLKVLRFTVLFPPRIYGVSSWNTGLQSKWKFIKRTIDFSIKLKRRGVE